MRALVLLFVSLLPLVSVAETGRASWYSEKYEGQQTASGELYHRRGFTAASWGHFGQTVRVTNLANGKSVVVRVNDRGPARRLGRAIDLSEAAFAAIATGQDIRRGTARVSIQFVSQP